MSVERIYICDSPEQNPERPDYEAGQPCGGNVRTATPPPYLPPGFLRVEWGSPNGNGEFYFCGWDCLVRYAATQEMPTFATDPPWESR